MRVCRGRGGAGGGGGGERDVLAALRIMLS